MAPVPCLFTFHPFSFGPLTFFLNSGFNLPPSVFFLSFLCFIPFPSFHFLFCFVCLFVFVFGQVTIGIGDEVRRQNSLLDDMVC